MLEEKDLQAIRSMIDDSVKESENRMMAYFEAAIIPQFNLLADGQKNLLETLAPKNRVEALEDEMTFMKSVIKALSQEVEELKKAQ